MTHEMQREAYFLLRRKEEILNDLSSYLKEEKNNFVVEKINNTIANLKNENFDYIGDVEVAKILVLLKLKHELKN